MLSTGLWIHKSVESPLVPYRAAPPNGSILARSPGLRKLALAPNIAATPPPHPPFPASPPPHHVAERTEEEFGSQQQREEEGEGGEVEAGRSGGVE